MANNNNPRDDTHQCEKCLPAFCCNYFSFGIDEPESRKEYESLLWKLAHEKVSIYVFRNQWYIMIHTRCNFLTSDNKCGIYENRPYLCKEHSVENCEYTGEDYGFKNHFKSYDDLLEYIKENTNFRFKQDNRSASKLCVIFFGRILLVLHDFRLLLYLNSFLKDFCCPNSLNLGLSPLMDFSLLFSS